MTKRLLAFLINDGEVIMNNVLKLFCEETTSPLGMDKKNPRFSWKIENCQGIKKQTKYNVCVADQVEKLKTTGQRHGVMEQLSEQSWVTYDGKPLQSCQTYYWKVVLEYDHSVIIESEVEAFETGFLDSSCWKAKWITPQKVKLQPVLPLVGEDGNGIEVALDEMKLENVWRLRGEFQISDKKIKKARLYATAHGVYLPIIDSARVGSFELAPGHFDYDNQLAYQIYDITDLLTPGVHTLGALLAGGWYAGCIGFYGENCQYGTQLALLMQLHVTYEDGQTDIITTDEGFEAEQSAYAYGDMMVGEKLDARKIRREFFLSGYHRVMKSCVVDKGYKTLFAQFQNPIEILEQITPLVLWSSGTKEWVADFGKCIAGKVRIHLRQSCGQEIRMEHSEVLDTEGNFICNIREPYKNQTDIYICAGVQDEIYEPMFTYHGFRYVRITGVEGELMTEDLTAIVIGSKMTKTGEFSCSNQAINQLQKNIFRSQLSNMISIPTDCPQREKAGWTGDVQVYGAIACFNQNIRSFFGRWLADVRYNQGADGQVPVIVPWLSGFERAFDGITSSAGWSDVIVTLPWVLYQYYGDCEILKENYQAMEKWVEYQRYTAENENPEGLEVISNEHKEHLKYIWNTGFHFGDWLTPSASINLKTGGVEMMQSAILTMDIVPTIFFAISCKRMMVISDVLHKRERVKYYTELFMRIKLAFCYEFIDETNNLKSDLQGVHVLVLYADLVEGVTKKKIQDRLIELIHINENKLDTGFLSTPFLLDTLVDIGQEELACRILLNEECPSWLYEINQGATAIWESWQAILPNGQCSYLSMAHYAFGCVGDFLYRYFGGLKCMSPGYKKICFSPKWNSVLNSASVRYNSIYGNIVCIWKREDDRLDMQVQVPANTEAEIDLPELGVHIPVEPGEYSYSFKLAQGGSAE